MSHTYLVYLITDPLENNKGYVGITRQSLKRRLRAHYSHAFDGQEDTYKSRWLKKLFCLGQHPTVWVLDEVSDGTHWTREADWIRQLRAWGWTLTNSDDGGAGCPGWHPDEVQRRAISERLRGVPKSPEHRRKLALSHIGVKASPDTCAKMSLARRGRRLSAEHIAAAAAGHRGTKRSPEACANMTAAHARRRCSVEEELKREGGRVCRRCNQFRPLADYGSCKTNIGGIMRICRDCDRLRHRHPYTARKGNECVLSIQNAANQEIVHDAE